LQLRGRKCHGSSAILFGGENLGSDRVFVFRQLSFALLGAFFGRGELHISGGSSIYPGGGLGGPSCTFFLRGATEALGGGIREAPVQVDPCGKAHKIQPWVILHNV